MKFKLLALIFAIALVSYLCGFGASIAISNNIFIKGSAAGHKVGTHGKPERMQNNPRTSPIPPELVELSDRVRAGERASIRVHTTPGSVCTIHYVNPNREHENLPGQNYQITGPDGLCGWSWNIPIESNSGNAVIYLSAGGVLQQYTFTVFK